MIAVSNLELYRKFHGVGTMEEYASYLAELAVGTRIGELGMQHAVDERQVKESETPALTST